MLPLSITSTSTVPDPEFIDQFLRSIYVDNVMYSSSDVDKTFDLYLWNKTKLAEGGFRLRRFVTNSPALRKLTEENELQRGKDS